MVKVCVLGAAGGIGQPLSLLCKLDKSHGITELSLYDIQLAEGVSDDLSHINTDVSISGYSKGEGKDGVQKALQGSQVVVICAGIPRKPGMTRDDLFKVNARIVQNLTLQVVSYCTPGAKILLVTNPVNSLLPVMVETLKQVGKYQPGHVMGITTLDIIRAQTFFCEEVGSGLRKKNFSDAITVVGGHSQTTMVPILLKEDHGIEDTKNLFHRIQYAGDAIVKSKKGAGSATLSMAYAAYYFLQDVVESITGNKVKTVTFVPLSDMASAQPIISRYGTDYLALPVELKNGKVVDIDKQFVQDYLTDNKLLEKSCHILAQDVSKGKKFVIQAARL